MLEQERKVSAELESDKSKVISELTRVKQEMA